ncbi:DUF924 family protein [Limibacillus halophilus]
MTRREQVLDFWFAESSEPYWFAKDEAYDEAVRRRLEPLCRQALAGELRAWADSPKGALALCILLDQAPRNLYRGSAQAFAGDPLARDVARKAVERGFDKALRQKERLFLYLPFEHSEDLEDQHLCCRLTAELDEHPDWLTYAERHREIVERFGRFPHRNEVLGRTSSAEELQFLTEPNSSF